MLRSVSNLKVRGLGFQNTPDCCGKCLAITIQNKNMKRNNAIACVACAWRKNGRARRRHPSRVSLALARSPFNQLLPSACYTGYNAKENSVYNYNPPLKPHLETGRQDVASA